MSKIPTLFSIIESPSHPDFSHLYQRHGLKEYQFTRMRKAISALKNNQPDVVVADFLYGYGNNYAGVNVSNLDVFLSSLQKYQRDAKTIILVQPDEKQFVDQLSALFNISKSLILPVNEQDILTTLSDLNLILD